MRGRRKEEGVRRKEKCERCEERERRETDTDRD
jgi:hypothetical protein